MRYAVLVLAAAVLVILGLLRDRAVPDRAEREVPVAPVENDKVVIAVEKDTVIVRGEALFGHVTDMTGEPVAGARVKCANSQTVSGADGAYRIEAVSPIDVSAEGYAPLRVTDGPFKGERDLVLTRGATVRALVVDHATDEPVAGETVGLDGFGVRTTDVRGVAVFANVSSLGFHHGPGSSLGTLRLCDAGSIAKVVVAMPEPGTTVEYRLARWPTATLVGRVLVGEIPMQGARVSAFTAARTGRPAFFRAPRGASALETDARGRYRLVVAARAGKAEETTVRADGPGKKWAVRSAAVLAGRTTQVDDIVFEGVQITDVHVVDDKGAAVPGAVVSLRADTADAVTNKDGRARLYGRGLVYVRPREHAFAVARAAPEVRVVVRKGEPVTGVVVWKDGRAVSGALVRHGLGARTWTDEDGRFRFPHIAGVNGIAASIVYGGNYGRVTVVGRAKGVPAGATGVRIELDREGFAPVATMRGTVEDDVTGKKIARFRVKFYKDDRVLVSRKVGVGKFEVGIAEGEWLMFVGGPGYIGKDIRIRIVPGVPVPPQRLKLQAATAVTGVVRSRDTLEGGTIEFLKTNNAWKGGESAIGKDGSYSVDGLVPGTYLVRVTAAGKYFADPSWRVVDVKSGKDRIRFDIDVEPAGAVTVGVDRGWELRGNDLRGEMTIKDAQGIERVRLTGGHAVFPNDFHLPVGFYTITLKSPSAQGTKTIKVVAGTRRAVLFPRHR